jgi:tetratricopeptide (TPR) repeat protein
MRHPVVRLVVAAALLAAYSLTLSGGTAGDQASAPVVDADIKRAVEASQAAYSAGRYADALEPTRRLTEQLPTQAVYFHRLARIQHELGSFREEARAWEGVFRTSPTPVDACPMLAAAYEQTGDADSALNAYERCVEVEPLNPDLLLLLGRAYNAAERAADAQRVLEQALALAPEYPDVHLVLGVRNFADKHIEVARERFERFLALAPARRDEVAVWLERTRQVSQ